MSDERTRRPRPRRTPKTTGDDRRRDPRARRPKGDDEDRPRRKRRLTERDVRTKAAKLDGFVDLHIRCGLEDSIVRIRSEDYNAKITLGWMLRRKDIVLRSQLDNSETIILLRGTDNARLRISRPNQGRALPMYKVFLADELREQLIRGINKEGTENRSRAE